MCPGHEPLRQLAEEVKKGIVEAGGGVNTENAVDFLNAGAVGVGVGSSLVNKKYLENGEDDKITEFVKNLV